MGESDREEDPPGGSGEFASREGEDQLFELVHAELYKRARSAMRSQRAGHTLQATALVSEVYLKVTRGQAKTWKGKGHFIAVAARAMRQILIDYARRRRSAPRSTSDSVLLENAPEVEGLQLDVISLEESMGRLAEFDPEMAKAVEMRFYGGASREEIASALDLPKRTFDRRWQAARAWILGELS